MNAERGLTDSNLGEGLTKANVRLDLTGANVGAEATLYLVDVAKGFTEANPGGEVLQVRPKDDEATLGELKSNGSEVFNPDESSGLRP